MPCLFCFLYLSEQQQQQQKFIFEQTTNDGDDDEYRFISLFVYNRKTISSFVIFILFLLVNINNTAQYSTAQSKTTLIDGANG